MRLYAPPSAVSRRTSRASQPPCCSDPMPLPWWSGLRSSRRRSGPSTTCSTRAAAASELAPSYVPACGANGRPLCSSRTSSLMVEPPSSLNDATPGCAGPWAHSRRPRAAARRSRDWARPCWTRSSRSSTATAPCCTATATPMRPPIARRCAASARGTPRPRWRRGAKSSRSVSRCEATCDGSRSPKAPSPAWPARGSGASPIPPRLRHGACVPTWRALLAHRTGRRACWLSIGVGTRGGGPPRISICSAISHTGWRTCWAPAISLRRSVVRRSCCIRLWPTWNAPTPTWRASRT